MAEPTTVIHFAPYLREAWALVPVMMERIVKFAAEYDSEIDAAQLARSWVEHFVCDSPALFALGFVDAEGELIGHLLCQRQESFGAASLFVMQYELDRAIPRSCHREGMALLDRIARATGAGKIVALCEDPKVARAHKVYHGFEGWATVVRRRVPLEAEDGEVHRK